MVLLYSASNDRFALVLVISHSVYAPSGLSRPRGLCTRPLQAYVRPSDSEDRRPGPRICWLVTALRSVPSARDGSREVGGKGEARVASSTPGSGLPNRVVERGGVVGGAPAELVVYGRAPHLLPRALFSVCVELSVGAAQVNAPVRRNVSQGGVIQTRPAQHREP